jgi:hypothetical protein
MENAASSSGKNTLFLLYRACAMLVPDVLVASSADRRALGAPTVCERRHRSGHPSPQLVGQS